MRESFFDQHVPARNGLCSLAIIAAIVNHVNSVYDDPVTPRRGNGSLAMAFSMRWVGVELSFMLPGFLITEIRGKQFLRLKRLFECRALGPRLIQDRSFCPTVRHRTFRASGLLASAGLF
jgi:hypothetical protein